MPQIDIVNLTKKYGRIEALSSFNLQIDQPQCVSILGPNGAGKTTLLKALTNIIKPTSGTVKIDGTSVSENPMLALQSVGTLIEQPEFYPYLTGREIIEFAARVKGADKSRIGDEMEYLSKLLSMEEYLDRKTGTYSRGMKQRVCLAVALVMKPKILILDEPTFGLDPRGMKEVRDLIKNLKKERDIIILMSTHLISEAKEVSDRVIIVDKGKKIYDTDNESNDNVIKVTLEEPADINGIIKSPENLQITFLNESTILLTLINGIDNSTAIEKLMDLGFKIKWAEPYNDIEEKYLKTVSL
jgi:ABC-2 type transport system ATP-binding protein